MDSNKGEYFANLKLSDDGKWLTWDQWPDGCSSLWVMVFKADNSGTMWGAPIKLKSSAKAYIKGAIERDYVKAELWADGNSKYKSELLYIGEVNKPIDMEWEAKALELNKLATWLRQRAAVQMQLSKQAELHLRPVGRDAHKAASDLIGQLEAHVKGLLKGKVPAPEKELSSIRQQCDEIAKKANEKDGINPPPPEQKWYKTADGHLYLKAKDQSGFDRRPHILSWSNAQCYVRLWGLEPTSHKLYFSTDWNRFARGDFRSLDKLRPKELGTTLTGPLYIEHDEETITFDVPKRAVENRTPELTRETFPDWFKEQRKLTGLSQFKLAKKLGYNPSSISYWENGHDFPHPKNLAIIKDYFEDFHKE